MVATLTRRARRTGWLRGALVDFFLKRTRALAGFREMPKFCLVLLLTSTRHTLLSIGKAMEQAGCLEQAGISTSSRLLRRTLLLRVRICARWSVSGVPATIAKCSVARSRACCSPMAQNPPWNHGSKSYLKARLQDFQPPPEESRLKLVSSSIQSALNRGEVLVAPSTDPGWTPLFLTATGLVMEMGGTMSHGAVVAREYGIPAVVGVPGATERITTGQRITIDGSAGTVFLM